MNRTKRRYDKCFCCKRKQVTFVKSHVIPRSFFHLFRGNDPHSVVVDIENKRIDKKQAGFADPAMLCEDCEKKFGPFDEYGFKILGRSNLTERPLLHNGRLYGYEINCDTDRLHRFVLSVLWRAAVTRLPAFSSLELRQYREPLLRVIFATAPIDGGYYQTIIFRLADDYLGEFSNVMFEPVASFQKDKSVMCQLYIPRLKIVTFIGNRTYIPNWMKLYDPNKAVLAYLSASMNQQEYGFLHRIHSAYHAAKSSFR